MSKAEETRFLKVLHDAAIGPGRRHSIEDVAMVVYDCDDSQATKYGRKLYAQLDPNPDKGYDRFPAVKLPAFIRATASDEIARAVADISGGYFYRRPMLHGKIINLDAHTPRLVHNVADVVESILSARAPDSPGGTAITAAEVDRGVAEIDEAIESLLSARVALTALKAH